MSTIEDRIIVIRNSQSSHAGEVASRVIAPLQDAVRSEHQLVEVNAGIRSFGDNVNIIADLINRIDQPKLIVAGGDGTGSVAVNACTTSGVKDLRLGILGFGNNNDMARTFTSRDAHRDPVKLLASGEVVEARPLRVYKDGEHYRDALLYATLGWTARAAAEFDTPKARLVQQAGGTGMVYNLPRHARSYFADRSRKLPKFTLDNVPESTDTTDFLAINGPIVGSIIRSGRNYYEGAKFLRSTLDVSSFWRNAPFLGRSALNLLGTQLHLPGIDVMSTEINFGQSVPVPIQLDGEAEVIYPTALRIDKVDYGEAIKIIVA